MTYLTKGDTAERFAKKMEPGMQVLWYHEASYRGGRPIPAVVVEGFRDGCCNLVIADINSVHGELNKKSVYHASSPALHDHLGQLSPNAKKYGCWDFCPWNKDEYLAYFDMLEKEEVKEKAALEREHRKRRAAIEKAEAEAKTTAAK